MAPDSAVRSWNESGPSTWIMPCTGTTPASVPSKPSSYSRSGWLSQTSKPAAAATPAIDGGIVRSPSAESVGADFADGSDEALDGTGTPAVERPRDGSWPPQPAIAMRIMAIDVDRLSAFTGVPPRDPRRATGTKTSPGCQAFCGPKETRTSCMPGTEFEFDVADAATADRS